MPKQIAIFTALIGFFICICSVAIAAPPTRTISGFVLTDAGSGVEGVNVSGNNGATSTVTAADGSYSITVKKQWRGTVTVSKTGWLITPASKTYSRVRTDIPNENYTAYQPKISGYVTKQDATPLAGASVTANNGGGSDTSDSTGYYEIPVPYNWTGGVSASLSGYYIMGKSFWNVIADQTNQNFSGYQPTISGTTNITGATVTVSGVGAVTSTPNYSVVVPYGWSGTVSASLVGYNFANSPRSYANVTSNKFRQNFTPYQPTIWGSANIVGATIIVSGVGSIVSSPDYSVIVPYGWSGTISVEMEGYTFNGTPRTYTNVIDDKTGQSFTPQPTISGSTGVAGATVTASGVGNVISTPEYSIVVPYGWNGTISAELEGYSFSSRSYMNIVSNHTGQNLTPYQPTISGTTGIAGATVTVSGVGSVTSTPDYTITVPYGWTGTVSAELAGYNFPESPRTYTNLTSNILSQNFTPFQPTISGTTSVSGATVTVSGIGTFVSAPAYSVVVPYGWSGTISVELAGYHFPDSPRPYTNVTTNQTNQNFTSYKPTISGYVKKTDGTGLIAVTVAADNGGGSDTTDANGYYKLYVPYEWSGIVLANKLKWDISPDSYSYSNLVSNKNGQDFTTLYTGIIYVKADGTGDFDTIQAAIDVAVDGDVVQVADGTYTGYGNRDIDFLGKAITVCGNAADPNMVIIDCQASEDDLHRGFNFVTGEGPNSILEGVTIKNGYGLREISYSRGGAILISNSSPSIKKCILVDCYAEYGGGIGYLFSTNPIIENCIISGNSAWFGGGFCYADGIITNCIVSDNSATNGGGFYGGDGTIMNCTVSGNSADSVGGGLAYCRGIITNCMVSNNTALTVGGGFSNCNATISNCTVSGNSADSGGGIYGNPSVSAIFSNCIVWDNTAFSHAQIDGSFAVSYSCIQDWSGGGVGNISDDPLFFDATNGDYHLLFDSPCFNTGDPGKIANPNETDIDGDPRIVGLRVDMGADEFLSDEPLILLSGNNFSFSAYENYQNPESQYFNITSFSAVDSGWSVTSSESWVNINNSSGVLQMGQQDTIVLSIDITSLPVGTHNCQLTVTVPGAINSPQTINISLEILQIKISGVIQKDGVPLTGVPVFADNGGGSGVTSPNGYYRIVVPYDWSGIVTPDISQWPEWGINPATKIYSNVTSDRTNQNYYLYQPVIHMYFLRSPQTPISNYIDGVEVTITGLADPIIVDGYYELTVHYGWTGTITPSKPKFVFDPIEMSFENVTEQSQPANFMVTYLYGGGDGSLGDPYQIWTASDLYQLSFGRFDWDKHFILMADLDLSEPGAVQPARPIGNYNPPFRGSFDGNGHTISNLMITSEEDAPAGLFGYVYYRPDGSALNPDEMFIRDLGLIDPEISWASDDYYRGDMGALVGTFSGYGSQGPTDIPMAFIKNCYVVGGSVDGSMGVGGLIGYARFCEISGCYAQTSVSGTDFIGGFIGHASHGVKIDQCYADSVVAGDNGVGGFIGSSSMYRGYGYGMLSNCYSQSSVSGENLVGGFVGDLRKSEGESMVINCYSSGPVSGTGEFIGGFAGGTLGAPNGEYSYLTNECYWDTQSSGQSESYLAEGKTTAEMMSMETFVGWGCGKVWVIQDGVDYPRLAWEGSGGVLLTEETYSGGSGAADDPYLISTARQLNAIGYNFCHLDKSFKLIADIDMNELAPGEFTPIGSTFSFTGRFDGNDRSISNLRYSAPEEAYGYGQLDAGLFAGVGDMYYYSNTPDVTTEIYDLTLIDPNIVMGATTAPAGTNIHSYCGSLAGSVGPDVSISNINVINANVINNGDGDIGGVVAVNRGQMSNVVCSGHVEKGVDTYGYAGGIAGRNDYGILTGCSFSGEVFGDAYSGGLVGYNYGDIFQCSSKGTIVGDSYVGGLCGRSSSSIIDNSYSQCDVEGVSRIGGLCGYVSYMTINNCYSSGIVTGTEYTGGFVGYYYLGYNNNYPSIFTECLWDSDKNTTLPSSGYNSASEVAPETTANMKLRSTYVNAGWIFATGIPGTAVEKWDICEGTNYPRLLWQIPAGDFLCPEGVSTEDLTFFLDYWLSADSPIDLNGDGWFDLQDYAIFARNWLSY